MRILLGRILRAKRAGKGPQPAPPDPQTDWLARLGVTKADVEASKVATQERLRRLGIA